MKWSLSDLHNASQSFTQRSLHSLINSKKLHNFEHWHLRKGVNKQEEKKLKRASLNIQFTSFSPACHYFIKVKHTQTINSIAYSTCIEIVAMAATTLEQTATKKKSNTKYIVFRSHASFSPFLFVIFFDIRHSIQLGKNSNTQIVQYFDLFYMNL